MKTNKLSVGTVEVYEFGDNKLHVYKTADALGDAAFIVESANNLIGIELPSFTDNLKEWKDYYTSLNKPLNDVIISDHPAGASFVGGKNIWGTKNAKKSAENGASYGISQGLLKAFGPAFHGNDLVKINNILVEGKNTISGVDFVIYDRGSSFDVEIPSMNVIYTHMLGKYCHSIIGGDAHLDAMIELLESFKSKNYKYILSSHAGAEEQDAVTEKIAYLKTIKEIAAKCKTGEEFSNQVKNTYPNYTGVNYLDMTTGNFYKN